MDADFTLVKVGSGRGFGYIWLILIILFHYLLQDLLSIYVTLLLRVLFSQVITDCVISPS
jgi:hypothetical protein